MIYDGSRARFVCLFPGGTGEGVALAGKAIACTRRRCVNAIPRVLSVRSPYTAFFADVESEIPATRNLVQTNGNNSFPALHLHNESILPKTHTHTHS